MNNTYHFCCSFKFKQKKIIIVFHHKIIQKKKVKIIKNPKSIILNLPSKITIYVCCADFYLLFIYVLIICVSLFFYYHLINCFFFLISVFYMDEIWCNFFFLLKIIIEQKLIAQLNGTLKFGTAIIYFYV